MTPILQKINITRLINIDREEMMTWNPEECVARGVEYLDKNHPGWWLKIDLNKLDMGVCEKCIIGQAVCDFADWQVITFDEMNSNHAIELGFNAPWMLGIGRNYKALDELWTEVVKEKFNSGSLS